ELFAGMNVPDSDFEIVGGSQAVGVKTVVDIPAVVPTQDEVALVVAVGVGAEDVLIQGFHQLNLVGAELPVELVEDPGDGAHWDEFGGDNAVAHLAANEA